MTRSYILCVSSSSVLAICGEVGSMSGMMCRLPSPTCPAMVYSRSYCANSALSLGRNSGMESGGTTKSSNSGAVRRFLDFLRNKLKLSRRIAQYFLAPASVLATRTPMCERLGERLLLGVGAELDQQHQLGYAAAYRQPQLGQKRYAKGYDAGFHLHRKLGEEPHCKLKRVVVVRLKAVRLMPQHLGHHLAELRDSVEKEYRHRGVLLGMHQAVLYFGDDAERPLPAA